MDAWLEQIEGFMDADGDSGGAPDGGAAAFSGMIGVTFFGIFMTPVFYVLVRKLSGNRPLAQHEEPAEQPQAQNTAA